MVQEMSRPPRILVIDDDPVSRQTLAEVLEAAGFAIAAPDEPADLALSADSAPPSGPPCLRFAKPVRVGALLTSIRDALARRPAAAAIRIGQWTFDAGGRVLEDAAGTRVRLTDKEAAILDHLSRAGGVVPRETLLAEVWGYSASVSTHTLETHIYRLRRKIETDPARARLLVTGPGGYRLMV